MKKTRIVVCSLCVLLVVSTLLGGCGKEKEKNEILENMKTALADISSMETVLSLNLDLRASFSAEDLEGMLQGGENATKTAEEQYGAAYDVEMELTKVPAAVHMTAHPAGGSEDSETLSEGYSLYQDGILTSFEKDGNVWNRSTLEVAEDYATAFSCLTSMALQMVEFESSLKLKSEDETVEGKSTYLLEGTLDVSAADGLLGLMDMAGSYSEVLKGEKASVSLWIYQDSCFPAKIEVDMTEALKALYEKMAEEMETEEDETGNVDFSIHAFTTSVLFRSFNEDITITVPDESTAEIIDVEPDNRENGGTTLEDWKEYVIGEAEKFDVDIEALFDITKEKMEMMEAEEWESLLYDIYKEAGLYGDIE